MIRFFVAGLPKAMQVSGARRVPLASGKIAHLPTKRNAGWALLVGEVGRRYAPDKLLDGPVSFTAVFFLPKPVSAGRAVLYPLKRPDLDNLTHKLTDQFNGVFWRDDSQIVDVAAHKRFAIDKPGVEIIVSGPNEIL